MNAHTSPPAADPIRNVREFLTGGVPPLTAVREEVRQLADAELDAGALTVADIVFALLIRLRDG